MCVYIYTYIHTYIRTCIHTYLHTCMHAYIHTYIVGSDMGSANSDMGREKCGRCKGVVKRHSLQKLLQVRNTFFTKS